MTLLLDEEMKCLKCGMPPIPSYQLQRGDLPICYSGHTLTPQTPNPPPQRIEEEDGRKKERIQAKEATKARGAEIARRAKELGLSMCRLGHMVGKSETSVYNVTAGFASEKLMVLLESRLDEEERKPREPKKAKKYLFE